MDEILTKVSPEPLCFLCPNLSLMSILPRVPSFFFFPISKFQFSICKFTCCASKKNNNRKSTWNTSHHTEMSKESRKKKIVIKKNETDNEIPDIILPARFDYSTDFSFIQKEFITHPFRKSCIIIPLTRGLRTLK